MIQDKLSNWLEVHIKNKGLARKHKVKSQILQKINYNFHSASKVKNAYVVA